MSFSNSRIRNYAYVALAKHVEARDWDHVVVLFFGQA